MGAYRMVGYPSSVHTFLYPATRIVAGYYGITLAVRVGPSIFWFSDDHLSKCQWIFTKLGVCIDIVEIWFGIVNGQISSIFDRVICPRQICFHFRMITLVNINGFSPNLVFALILWRSVLGLLIGKFRQFLTVICLGHVCIFISGR